MLSSPKIVYAVVALMCGKNVNASMIPSSKDELYKFNEGKSDKEDTIVRFPYISHNGYNFERWKTASDVYDVAASTGFEPYYIGHRNYPFFDEVFFGCGWDKVTHMTELSQGGYKIKVLPDGFIAHLRSDGMGQPWCRKWEGDVRTVIKQELFRNRLGKAISSNTHMMPWFNVDFTEKQEAVAEAPKCDPVEKTVENQKDVPAVPEEQNDKNEAIDAIRNEHAKEIERLKKEAEEKELAAKNEMEKQLEYLQAKLKGYEENAALMKSAAGSTQDVTKLTFVMLGMIVSGMGVIFYKIFGARRRGEHGNFRGRI